MLSSQQAHATAAMSVLRQHARERRNLAEFVVLARLESAWTKAVGLKSRLGSRLA